MQAEITVIQFLKSVRAKIAKKKNWIKDHDALSADAMPVDATANDATCFCLSGAMRCVEYNLCMSHSNYEISFMDDAVDYIQNAIDQLYPNTAGTIGPFFHVPTWNDRPERTHKEVLAVIDKAIEKAVHDADLVKMKA